MFDDKEPTTEMQTRVLIAFALSAMVLLFFAPKPGQKKDAPKAPSAVVENAAAPQTSPAAPPGKPPATPPATPQVSNAAAEAPAVLKEDKETETVVESDLYEVHFSNRGGVVTNWYLKNFKDDSGKRLDVVNPLAVQQVGWPFSIYVEDAAIRGALAGGLFVVKATSRTAPATVTFDYSDGTVSAHKEFHFEAKSYLAGVTTEVKRGGQGVAHEVSWRGGFGDRTAPKYNLSSVVTTSVADKQEHKKITDVKADYRPVGPFHYIALEDLFFAAVFMPGGEGDSIAALPSAGVFKTGFAAAAGGPLDLAGITVGGRNENHLRAYIGPKDLGLLQKISPDPRAQKALDAGQPAPTIASVMDFGWFELVAVPLFMSLKWIYAHIVANYGWAIILLTIAINFVLLPLKISSMKSSMKMQKLAPQVKEINDRYKKYKMNDPKKAEANEQVMALYKKEGVNPLGGCLPMLVQLPFLYGFYKVLSQVIEMRQAPWIFWIADLSRPEAGWFHLLPVLMIASMVVLQKLTPQVGGDPMQQKMMTMMPIMMGVMFYNVSSGLVLYWLAGNIVQIGQQYFINKTSPA